MWASVVTRDGGGVRINIVVPHFRTPFGHYLLLVMDVLYVFTIFYCLLLTCDGFDGHSTESNEKSAEIELFPPKPTYAGQTRIPRTIFKKLHSGAAFITGLKLGAILSKKGFELGHGKIASSHSFQIFGKSVNSAMSLSYGDTGSLLPLLNDGPTGSDPMTRTGLKKEEKKVFRVTVIEPNNKTLVNSLPSHGGDEKKPQDDASEGSGDDAIVLYQDFVDEEPGKEVEANFIADHSKRVKEFNDSILRRKNSKF